MSRRSQPGAAGAVAQWLLPDGDARPALQYVLENAVDDVVVEEFTADLRAVMTESTAELVACGWRAHPAVARAVASGANLLVPLRDHTVTAVRQQAVGVAGARELVVPVELLVRITLCDAAAVVHDGEVVAVRAGRATAVGTLTVAGIDVARRTLTFAAVAERVGPAPCAGLRARLTG
jgi:hypothetical protein